MQRYQLRLLMLSAAAVVLIVASVFFADWFVLHIGGNDGHVDLRTMRFCSPQCVSVELGGMKGMYPALASLAFWTSLPLFVVIATQAGAKLLSGYAYPALAKVATGLGTVVFFAAFGAGFLSMPDGANLAGFQLFTVDRMWGPLMLLAGSLAGIIAVRYALTDSYNDDAGEYKPVVIPKPGDSRDGVRRLPVTPLSLTKVPRPAAEPTRSKPDSQPPPVTTPSEVRVKSPTQPPAITRARTSSSGPIDVSARLLGGTAALDIAIRPALPESLHVPEDQIAIAPESGLVIRKRTPSTAPLEPYRELPLPPDIGVTVRTRPPSIAPPMMASIASALGVPQPQEPGPLAPMHRVSYAVATAEISTAGILATREDGLSKLIKWGDIVGIVARRLPQMEPHGGLPFVDIVSSAGSTMRMLPSTELLGHTLVGDPHERARTLVNLLAAQALSAKLDSATKVFANGTSKAAQLRDEKTLATHDARLA